MGERCGEGAERNLEALWFFPPPLCICNGLYASSKREPPSDRQAVRSVSNGSLCYGTRSRVRDRHIGPRRLRRKVPCIAGAYSTLHLQV